MDNDYKNIALETLNLAHNEIHSLDRYLFQFTPNLTRLYLNNNPIEILDHVTVLALSSAANLEVTIMYMYLKQLKLSIKTKRSANDIKILITLSLNINVMGH